jgi:hypothetical protein
MNNKQGIIDMIDNCSNRGEVVLLKKECGLLNLLEIIQYVIGSK